MQAAVNIPSISIVIHFCKILQKNGQELLFEMHAVHSHCKQASQPATTKNSTK